MVNKWNRIKQDFLKELIVLYLKGSEELKNKSLEIYCPNENKRIYIDFYVNPVIKSEINPFSEIARSFYSGPIYGTYFEINKTPFPMLPMVVPIFDIDASSSFSIIDSFGCKDEKGYYWVRSMDTEDLIKELKNKEKYFLTSDLCTETA